MATIRVREVTAFGSSAPEKGYRRVPRGNEKRREAEFSRAIFAHEHS